MSDSLAQVVAPSAAPAPLPTRLHAVSTVHSQPPDPVRNQIEGLDGSPLSVNTTVAVPSLPGVGAAGDLISLPTAMRAEISIPQNARSYVWLAWGAPPTILRRLVAQGVRVDAVSTPGPLRTGFDQGPFGVSYQFFLFAAFAAVALVLAAAGLSFQLGGRRRAFELAVMRALGVSPRTLRRTLLAEQLLTLLPGLLLGIAAALISGVVALRAMPEFASNRGQPPLELAPPAQPLLLLSLALLGLLVATALAGALLSVRTISPEQLRSQFP